MIVEVTRKPIRVFVVDAKAGGNTEEYVSSIAKTIAVKQRSLHGDFCFPGNQYECHMWLSVLLSLVRRVCLGLLSAIRLIREEIAEYITL